MKVPVTRDRGNSGGANEALAPLIVVVFLLLIAFVRTSSFATGEYPLPVPASEASGTTPTSIAAPPPEADFDDVVVRLRNGEGGVVALEVNGAPMESEAATLAFLRSLAELKADAPIVLHPNPDVAVKHVIRLYDGARLAGSEAVRFAVYE